ncbi:ferritin [Parasediminibacterium sp. JCM 36343]|uniref:ferritin n=1 Tax=Parasediminibacterium sp. JCM 36343 TaxID=3374279 RepID=UPI00397D058F
MELSQKSLEALNAQVKIEADASHQYLATAAWLESQPGLDGLTQFFYKQAQEEREHMTRLMHYIAMRKGKALVQSLNPPQQAFKDLKEVFELFLRNEQEVTKSINQWVGIALNEGDYITFQFWQWYLKEQLEEENQATKMLDELSLIGENRAALYSFDKDILNVREKISQETSEELSHA